VTLIDKLLDEGGHRRAALIGVRVTERGEEACEWVGKLVENRRQHHFSH